MAVAAVPDGKLRLADGRTLAYAQWGEPRGVPVLLFHGTPGSRLFVPNLLVTAARGVRLITIDRPGYGGSDPKPGRSVPDWADDVTELCDALALDGPAVVGHSAGCAYALACGVRMADRIERLVLVSPVVPSHEVRSVAAEMTERERAIVALAAEDPPAAARRIADEAGWLRSHPELFLELPRPKADQLVLADRDVQRMYLATIEEAVRQGLDAFALEQVLQRRPWGFALADVMTPVHVWHGQADAHVPAAHARELARRLPDATISIDPTAGHGLVVARWGAILDAVTAA